MACEETTTTSDLYSYCDICRFNHTQKKKHIYLKKHKEKLQRILAKFRNKIKEMHVFLRNPVIEEGACDHAKNKFWCHFCKNEFTKHVTDNFKTIIYGGAVEHLSSEEHCNSTDTFWRFHRLDVSTKPGYIVSNVDFDLYKKKLVPLVDEYDSKANQRSKQVLLQIKLEEDSRKLLFVSSIPENNNGQHKVEFKTVRNEHNVVQNPDGTHNGVRVWKGGIVKYASGSDQITQCRFNNMTNYGTSSSSCSGSRGRSHLYTVKASGEGLSSVQIKINNRKGNIHTGATPPWLCNNSKEEEEQCNVIGPSQEDFDKHLERVRKSKLNPNRVGANFDHQVTSTGDDDGNWLPSFGRVWNDGARWKSRTQYYNEIGGKRKKK